MPPTHTRHVLMIDSAGGLFAVMIRFVALTAATGTLGAAAFLRFVMPRLPQAQRDDGALQQLGARTLAACAAIVTLSAAARLLAPVTTIPGAEPGGSLAALSQAWGIMLALQGAAGAWIAMAAWRQRQHASARASVDIAVAALALTLPFAAHAGRSAELRGIAVLVDLVHVLAAGAWVGALALVTAAALRGRTAADASARMAALVVAFHPVAVLAAPAVFVTGLLTAWLRMGAPAGIAAPTYSGLFVAKLLLVGVTGFIGAGHSKLATRRDATVAPVAVGRSLVAECAFAVLVLAVTAVLVGTPPIG